MFGFAVILFFSVTGITLNHPGWFGSEREIVTDCLGKLDKAWLQEMPFPQEANDGESEWQIADRLSVVEFLRNHHGIHGALSEFRIDETECIVVFKGPGYAADAFVDRTTGTYELTVAQMGSVAILNDLHKGRDSGPAWSILIDVSAILMTISSFTGLVLLLLLRRKRVAGIITAVVGTVGAFLVYWFLVP